MSAFLIDLKYGLRMLMKNPGFSIVVVLVLAMGIGANTAIFGFLDRILLRPLPVKKPHELVMVQSRLADGGIDGIFSYPFYRGLRDQSEETFSGLIAHWWGEVNLSVEGSEREVLVAPVSSNYFSVLGVKPVLGRGFLAEEDQAPTGHPVAVISHRLWRRQFLGDPAVVGKTIRVDNYPLTIVGVAPRGFTGTCVGVGPSVYVPLKVWAHTINPALQKPNRTWLGLLWRPERGMSRRQAQAALQVAAERLQMAAKRLYAIEPEKLNFPAEMLVADGSRGFGADELLWRPLALLQLVTAPILIIACVNVANMLLARGITRQKEIAIRRATGAGRGAIIRQLLTESTLLAVLAGACGVLLAHWLSIALRSALTEASASNTPVGLDGRILVFAMLVSLGSILVFGLIPALQASRPDPMAVIKDDAGAVTILGRRGNLRNCLVVVQTALSVVVLAFGGLCIRSLLKLHFMDPGFDHTRVLGVSVNFEHEQAKGLDPQQFFSDLKERVATYPGVQAVSLAASVPLSPRPTNKTSIEHIEDFQIPSDPNFNNSWRLDHVGPGYFQTLGIPILLGRDFSVQDGPAMTKVMIINDLLGRRWWPNQEPIGKRVTFRGGDVREVVGLVKAVKLDSIKVEPVPMMFLPVAQPVDTKHLPAKFRNIYRVKLVLLVRTKGIPKTIASLLRSELNAAGLNPAAYDIRTSAEYARHVSTEKRMIIGILNVVGFVGLVLAATGIFSVMAFEMGRRTREIGIRMALGAKRADVRKLILRKGLLLTGVGLGLGIAFSLMPLRFLIHLLPDRGRYSDLFYGIHIWEPLTYAAVTLLVALITLAACWLPAHRAAKVDPMQALRYE